MLVFEPVLSLLKSKFVVLLIGFTGLCVSGYGLYLSYKSNSYSISPMAGDTSPSRAEVTSITDEEEILVYISGAVIKPGVYTLPYNGRVVDVLKMAGGISKGADASYIRSTLNLASKLTDAQNLHIPWKNEITFEILNQKEAVMPQNSGELLIPSGSQSNTTLSINNCSKDALLAIRGIGETYATKIIQNRPYTSFDELTKKVKLPKSVVEQLKNSTVL